MGYPIKIGGATKANILMDVFNLFNRQGATILDQRYNLTSDGHCAGIPSGLCNGDGGLLAQPNSTNTLGVIANPRATATNPDFLKESVGTQFTRRAARIGVRSPL